MANAVAVSKTSNTSNDSLKFRVKKVRQNEFTKYLKALAKFDKVEKLTILNEIQNSLDSKCPTQTKSIDNYWQDFAADKITAVVWYQRLYLFADSRGANGHEWQRELMSSMINGIPLPFIWLNKKGIRDVEIIDGGHRTRTIDAWFRDCIKLPNVCMVNVLQEDGVWRKTNLGNCCWSEIVENFPKFADWWKTNYMIETKVYDNLSDFEAAGIFFKLNNGNELTKPEFRNAITSILADFIREKADFKNIKSLRMFREGVGIYKDTKGAYVSDYHKIPLKGRMFDDFVSKVAYIVFKEFVESPSNKLIEGWYKKEQENEVLGKTSDFTPQLKSKLNKTLKWIDDVIMSETVKGSRLNTSEILMLLRIKNYWDSKHTFKVHDKGQLLKSFRQVITYLKADAKLTNPKVNFRNRSDMITNITKMMSSMSTASTEELESWIPIIADLMSTMTHEKYRLAVESNNSVDQLKYDGGYKLLDKKRSFSKSQKDSAEVDQDFECVYHYYCGNMVGEGHSSAGDHSGTAFTNYGSTDDDNLNVCCTSCNTQKGSMSHEEFEMILDYRMKQNKK